MRHTGESPDPNASDESPRNPFAEDVAALGTPSVIGADGVLGSPDDPPEDSEQTGPIKVVPEAVTYGSPPPPPPPGQGGSSGSAQDSGQNDRDAAGWPKLEYRSRERSNASGPLSWLRRRK